MNELEVKQVEGYMTVQQAAEKWNVTPRQVQLWCKTNKICGVQKWGRDWAIPEDAARPAARKRNSTDRINGSK